MHDQQVRRGRVIVDLLQHTALRFGPVEVEVDQPAVSHEFDTSAGEFTGPRGNRQIPLVQPLRRRSGRATGSPGTAR